MTAPRVSGLHRRGQAFRRPWAAAAMLVPALALAGCSSSGGREPAAQAESGGEVAQTERMKVAMAAYATPGDTFWDRIRAGAEEAAAKDDVDFLYASDPEGGRRAQLVQQYIDQGVDGIAVTLAKRDPRHGGTARCGWARTVRAPPAGVWTTVTGLSSPTARRGRVLWPGGHGLRRTVSWNPQHQSARSDLNMSIHSVDICDLHH